MTIRSSEKSQRFPRVSSKYDVVPERAKLLWNPVVRLTAESGACWRNDSDGVASFKPGWFLGIVDSVGGKDSHKGSIVRRAEKIGKVQV
jgi:hypothetical protein